MEQTLRNDHVDVSVIGFKSFNLHALLWLLLVATYWINRNLIDWTHRKIGSRKYVCLWQPANIRSLSASTFFCPRLWMMLTLSKSRVRVWVTVPVSLSRLITAPAQNTDCINQATFLIPVYVLTIYPLLLVLSLLENLRETEIGAVML